MVRPNVADWHATVFNTVHEIAHVIARLLALTKFVDSVLQPLRSRSTDGTALRSLGTVLGDHMSHAQFFGWFAGQTTTVDTDLALVSFDHQLVATRVNACGMSPVELECDVEFRWNVETIFDLGNLDRSLWCDRCRSGIVHSHRPHRNVSMMSAPISHLPAGILEPPTEIEIGSLRAVGDFRRLPQPHVPIDMFGTRHVFERPTLLRCFDADQAVQFVSEHATLGDGNGLQKDLVELAPLLGSDLKNFACFFGDFATLLPFANG